MSRIGVVGGTRFFGRRLVARLLDRGDDVVLISRGRSPDPFEDRVLRRRADAHDVEALTAAVADQEFDAVVHQMIYSPVAAQAAVRAFAGRTPRLVMTSTIEVYAATGWPGEVPPFSPRMREDEIDLATVPVEMDRPWGDPAYLEANYGAGKRQAEAVLLSQAPFDVATIRAGHVLAEQGDFTGRLRGLVEQAVTKTPIRVHANAGGSSFVHADDLAAFMMAAADASVTGPLNAASPDVLTTADLLAHLAPLLGREPELLETSAPEAAPGASPFTWPTPFVMDVGKAERSGLGLVPASRWLESVVAATLEEVRCSI